MKTFKQNRFLSCSVFLLAVAAILISLPVKAEGAVLGCTSSATLEDLINCIEAQMPHMDEGYVPPTSTQMNDLRTVILQMLNGQINITLPTSLVGIMEVKNFTESGKFIHIEQEPSYRQPANWINAVNDTFVPGGPVNPPDAPTGLTATAGKRKITLNWNASSGASSYNVKRSSVSGGPYDLIKTGVTSTTYTDSNLTPGAAYYYVVSAVNSAGESGNSNQAGATVK